ncbi:carbohydrate-binding protein [Pontiellaceae bacterium B1224]|nr:carbohydrate-binding protein [Pontiellaceae bacterium B1224]
MKKYSAIMAACAAFVQLADAALLPFPDMTSGGTFTLAAGDSWVNTVGASVAENNVGVVNVNGDWSSPSSVEMQLGGVNWSAATDLTINIGSTGSMMIDKAWVADGSPYGGSIVINIATGGVYGKPTAAEWVRYHSSDNWSATIWDLWDIGMLKRDGLTKADLTAGVDDAFTDNFTLVGDVNGAYTITAIGAPDVNPPTPNPAVFEVAPTAAFGATITMTAIGSDANGPVEYYFDETSGNPGGSDSGWTTDSVYRDTGLTAGMQYTYTVQMRDGLGNTGTVSAPASATAEAGRAFVHPGIALTVEGLDHIKANLNVEPWKTGYEDMLDSNLSSLNYTMKGPFAEVGRSENNGSWESDMEAVHSLARMWYFTENEAYAQKARDILISWATTHTEFLEGETYLSMGYECMHVFEGADILRGTWPGWTQSDTDICKAYFENVWWDIYHIAVPHPLRSANQGMSQFTAALGVAIFNDDEEKFEQCLQVFRADAAAALGSSLPNGQFGDTGRDAHDQGQLMLMAWAAEAFWNQGVDVYAEFDNRMLAAIEYLSRYNLLVDTPFIQAGTVYDVYPEIHTFDGPYANWGIETKMVTLLHGAYVVRKGMRSPYLEKYFTCLTQNKDSYCYLKAADTSTATVSDPIDEPADFASVTSLSDANLGDCTTGSATYSAGTKTWTVTGRGSSLSAGSADLRFAYLPVTGDATIIAQLTSLSGSDNNARAGVLITDTLNESSPMHAIVITNPSGDEEMYSFYRDSLARSSSAFGGSGDQSYGRMPDPKVPYWLKIERIGNRVNSYSSPDGASWSCGQSAEYDFGETAYVGLAVSSDDYSSTATATFTDVRITGGDGGEASEVPPAPFAIYASPGGDQVPLRWLESFEADSYKIWRTTTPGGPYTLLTEQTGTSFIDTNVLFGTHYYYAVSGVNSMGEGPRSPESTFVIPDITFYEAEDYDAQSGVQTEDTRDFFGGRNVGWIGDGDWCRYEDIMIGTGAVFRARCAGYGDPVGTIEVRLGGTAGTLVGELQPTDTGATQNWATSETVLSAAAIGTHDLYLVFKSATGASSPGINFNWFDITYPHISELDLGMDTAITVDPATHELTNLGGITAWDSTSTHLKLADGSDLNNLDFPMLGITSWKTTDFSDAAKTTIWDGANLSGITLYADGNFGAGDSFIGADFSDVVWGQATATADASEFFSEGSGATSAATAADAITFVGADLSLISGQARTVMINNLGGFDGAAPIGAIFDPVFIINSGWDKTALVAAGWQYMAVDPFAIFEAEEYDDQSGVSTQNCSDTGGGLNVQAIKNGDWCAYYDVDFGEGADGFQARVASNTSGGSIEIRLDSPTGTLIGTCIVDNTTGWQIWETVSTTVSGASGVHDLYLVFTDASTGYLFNVNWFTFTDSTPPAAPEGLAATAGDGTVSLDWADNTELDLTHYDVYRSTISGSGYLTVFSGQTTSDYVDSGVTNGSTYYYVVTAIDVSSNESAVSNEDSATPLSFAEPAEILPELSISNGTFSAQFTGTVGQHYRLEYAEDLMASNAWITVTDITSLATSPFAVSASATNDAGYYRIIGNP